MAKATKKVQGKRPAEKNIEAVEASVEPIKGQSTVFQDRIEERSAGKADLKPIPLPPEPHYEPIVESTEPSPFDYKALHGGVTLGQSANRERYIYVFNNAAGPAVLNITPITDQVRPPTIIVNIQAQAPHPTKIGPLSPGPMKLFSANQQLVYYER